jgi:hypothetical protein
VFRRAVIGVLVRSLDGFLHQEFADLQSLSAPEGLRATPGADQWRKVPISKRLANPLRTRA